MIRVRCSCIAESEGDPIRVVVVSERVLAEPDALGNGSADSIYLRDKIASWCSRMMGRPEGSNHHVVRLRFGNPRCDRSRSDQIRSGPGGGIAKFTENTVGVVLMAKCEFTESNALSDGSTNAIYLEDQVVN